MKVFYSSFEDNADDSFNVYLLDEKNRLEIYRQCEGSKDDKVREINQIYQSLGSKIVKTV